MKFDIHDFRNADAVLRPRLAWDELEATLGAISPAEILAAHGAISTARGRAPAGGQAAVNAVFRDRLGLLGWQAEPRLFAPGDLAAWKMDFIKERIGVEVSFNHAEAMAWTLSRLNIAAESPDVLEKSRVEVGVAIYPRSDFKAWGSMDSAVGTFETAIKWLKVMRPILPIPLLLVGLRADGFPAVTPFRGTTSRRKLANPSATAPLQAPAGEPGMLDS